MVKQDMNKYNYQICMFLHKNENGRYVIHSTDYNVDYWHDIGTQEAKAEIERFTQLNFVKCEKALIDRKLEERNNGIKTSEKYLLLK